MSDANHEIREIAEELTELGLSYHPGFEKIFGPNNPFSNRWNLVLSFGQSVTGKEIYRHIKTDSDADTVELNRVIANGTEACKGLVDIFGGHDDYSLSNIRTGIDSGLLLFSAKSIEARNRPFSSVDLGRMMLVDI